MLSNWDHDRNAEHRLLQEVITNIITAGSCHHFDIYTSMKSLNKYFMFCSSCDRFKIDVIHIK